MRCSPYGRSRHDPRMGGRSSVLMTQAAESPRCQPVSPLWQFSQLDIRWCRDLELKGKEQSTDMLKWMEYIQSHNERSAVSKSSSAALFARCKKQSQRKWCFYWERWEELLNSVTQKTDHGTLFYAAYKDVTAQNMFKKCLLVLWYIQVVTFWNLILGKTFPRIISELLCFSLTNRCNLSANYRITASIMWHARWWFATGGSGWSSVLVFTSSSKNTSNNVAQRAPRFKCKYACRYDCQT